MKYILAALTISFFLFIPSHVLAQTVPSQVCLGSCPTGVLTPTTNPTTTTTTTSPSPSTAATTTTSPSQTAPSPSTNPSPSTSPCATSASSVEGTTSAQSIHRRRSKWRRSSGNGFLQQFILFLLQLLQQLFQQLGINIQLPTTSCPTTSPTPSSAAPSSAPSTAAQPSTSSPSTAAPSSAATPSSGAAPTSSASTGTTSTTCSGNGTGGSVSLTGYTLDNCEDFNETGLSAGTLPSGWSAYTGTGSTVVGTGRTPSQCAVANGVVSLTQTSDGATCGMASSFGQQYGLWEARMRAYTTGSGSGSAPHPVLILWPDSNVWPSGGEYDYAEANIGSQMQAFFHCATSAGGNCATGTSSVDFSQWHNYAIKWTSTSVTGYIDGQQWITTTDASALAPGSMHETIQLDNLSGSTPVDPGVMQVDWVHVYKAQ